MPRYTPYGITEDDFTEPHTKITPERVKTLMEIYRRNHIDYPWSEEDRNEQIFDYRKGLKPTTYTYDLEQSTGLEIPTTSRKNTTSIRKRGEY